MRKPEFAGKKYYAWIAEKDLMTSFWNWYVDDIDTTTEFKSSLGFENNRKNAWKMVLKAVMTDKGRIARTIRTIVNDYAMEVIGYDKVAFVIDGHDELRNLRNI
jgi:hypothetical protein